MTIVLSEGPARKPAMPTLHLCCTKRPAKYVPSSHTNVAKTIRKFKLLAFLRRHLT